MSNLLDIENLRVTFPTRQGDFQAVRDISFSLGQERLGIVGESGSGKSMTGRAILRLIRPPGRIEADKMQLNGKELLAMSDKEMRGVRGQQISMIMQDPKFSLNPVMRISDQIIEIYRFHTGANYKAAHSKALEMLNAVSIRDPERVMRAYPHEMSGGMGQRIMIAMMLVTEPKILIADEPTSALDVSVQTSVLQIIDRLVKERGMGLIFISHDLNLVASFCDRVLIMYAGRIVEVCDAKRLHDAKHPYTRGLLNSLPRIDAPQPRLEALTRDPEWNHAPSVSGLL